MTSELTFVLFYIGGALARAGPAGALIAYIIVGSVAYSSLCAVGEVGHDSTIAMSRQMLNASSALSSPLAYKPRANFGDVSALRRTVRRSSVRICCRVSVDSTKQPADKL